MQKHCKRIFFFFLLAFYCCRSTSNVYLEIRLKNHHTFRSQTRQHISSLLHFLYYSTLEVCESRHTASFCPLFHQQHPSTLWREFWFKRQISMIFTSTSSYLQLYCKVFSHNHLILKKVHLCACACQDWTTYVAHFISRRGKLEIINYSAGEQKHRIVDSFTAVIHNPPLQSSSDEWVWLWLPGPTRSPGLAAEPPPAPIHPPALFSITSFKAREQHFETWCSWALLEQLLIGKQVRLHLPNSRSSATFHHCLANIAEY